MSCAMIPSPTLGTGSMAAKFGMLAVATLPMIVTDEPAAPVSPVGPVYPVGPVITLLAPVGPV